MKRFISILLLLFVTITFFPVTEILAYDKETIQDFVYDTIDLINNNVDNVIKLDDTETIEVNNEFQTCRLIIKSKDIPQKLNSIGITSGFEDYFIVQFKNEYDTEIAFNYYKKQKSILSVYPDEVISLSEFEINKTTTNKIKR